MLCLDEPTDFCSTVVCPVCEPIQTQTATTKDDNQNIQNENYADHNVVTMTNYCDFHMTNKQQAALMKKDNPGSTKGRKFTHYYSAAKKAELKGLLFRK